MGSGLPPWSRAFLEALLLLEREDELKQEVNACQMIERISHLNQRKMRKSTVARKTRTAPRVAAVITDGDGGDEDDDDEDEDLSGKYGPDLTVGKLFICLN